MTPAASADVVRFGAFDLDRRSGELRKAGRRLHMTPQAFQLLWLLAGRAGEVVTREDIRRVLWQDDTFVDVDSAVNACVSQIRALLADKAAAPRFIETLPRRGYRFVAPVETGAAQVVAPPPAPVEDAALPPSSQSRAGWRVTMVMAGAVLAASILLAVVASRAGASAERVDAAAPAYGVEALKKYEMARTGLDDAAPSELIERARYFQTAIGLEPSFAEAYAGLADAKLILAGYRAEEPLTAYAEAKAAAARALQINPRLGEAHAAYGAAVLFFDWNWTDAAAHLRQAETLAPDSPRVHHWYARYLTAAGRHADALRHARRAAALRPGSPSASTYAGVAAFYAGDYEHAREDCARAEALMPEFVPARLCLDGVASPDSRSPATPDAWLAAPVRMLRAGDRLGSLDRLQLAANQHSDALVFAFVHPALRDLAAEPRFRSLAERVGHPSVSNVRR